MKNAFLIVSAAVFGLGLGLFLNNQAHRYSEWLYLVHYGESPGMDIITTPRFFASPIFAAWGFFGALYAVIPARGRLKETLRSLGAYLLGTAAGFGLSLAVHPLFHRFGYRLSEHQALNVYTGLDVFVVPLLAFTPAFLFIRFARRR